MSSISLYISPEIRAYAGANGLAFTPDEIDQITTAVSTVGFTDEKGALRYNLSGGSVQTLNAAIGVMAVGLALQLRF